MCGAYSQTRRGLEYFIAKARAEKIWDRDLEIPDLFSDRFNVRPTQESLTVTDEGNTLEFRTFGIIPAWSKEAKMTFPTFNARSETISEKATFKKPFQQNRGVLIVDGYYEFAKQGKESVPYFFTVKDSQAFPIAIICDENTRATDKEIKSFSIITVPASPEFEGIHPRMPLILDFNQLKDWLNPDTNPDDLKKFFQPFSSKLMDHWPVSRAVNNSHSEGHDLIQPIKSERSNP